MNLRRSIRRGTAVAVGGAIGASLRHGCSLATTTLGGGEATWLLVVNLMGAFAMGVVFTFLDPRSPRIIDVELSPSDLQPDSRHDLMGAFMAVGLLGSFTTYSALAVLLLEHLQEGAIMEAGVMLGGFLVGGLAMVALGVKTGRRWRATSS